MKRGSIHEKDVIVINRYSTNIGLPKYIKQIVTYLKVEIDSNIIIGIYPWDSRMVQHTQINKCDTTH